MRRENVDTHSAVIVREGGRSSIPETSVIESISRGVLDTRLRGYDDLMLRRYPSVIASAPSNPQHRKKEERIASLRSQ
jgi:hypothetical protein